MKSISLQIPVIIVTALVIAGGSFYGGMVFAKSATKSGAAGLNQARQFGGAAGMGAARGQQVARMGGAGGGLSTGEVISKTATGFTIKLRDGGSKVVLIASSTSIGKMASGSIDDVAEGTGIVVTGTSNADGSITATTVQIRSASGTQPGFGEPPMGIRQPDGSEVPSESPADQVK